MHQFYPKVSIPKTKGNPIGFRFPQPTGNLVMMSLFRPPVPVELPKNVWKARMKCIATTGFSARRNWAKKR
jgi:hypothetical protein